MVSQLQFRDNGPDEEYQAWFVEVILPLSLKQSFTYRVPSALGTKIKPGQRVAVQFGKKKIYTGLVAEVHQNPPRDYTAKYLLEIIDEESIITPLQLEFWKWVADYYCCSLGDVMDAALPGNMKIESETKVMLHPDHASLEMEYTEKEMSILDALNTRTELTVNEIAELLAQKTVLPILKSLYEKGAVILKEEMNDAYQPRREVFVNHQIDLNDKELVEELFMALEAAPKQSDLLMAYLQMQRGGKAVLRRQLLREAGAASSSLEGLVKKEILSLYEDEVDRVKDLDGKGWNYELNEEQQRALDEIREALQKRSVALLHGITGSGKTHLYMELIDECLAEGRQALYLVPEIGLTTQLIRRLQAKYGKDIGIYHSKFNPDERVEIWKKVQTGAYKVILGVRSALFLPFREMGLLVIDEEHENSFKQYEPAPRYHARDAGIYLMSLYKGRTVMGTATPSFDSYFNAQRGKYGLAKLENRYGNIQLPEIILSDLRGEHKKKLMKSHFSSVLHQEMHKTLKEGGQVILFQNRRGYAPVLECTTCGWSPQCQNCDISLTYHQARKAVLCHYCGYREDIPKKCQACGNYTLKMLGFGTEKIEDELNIFFPEYKSQRMDQDTTRGKQAYNKIITAVEDGDVQILVGTQMVTKGLDFENVRLVGILNADQMLRYPDFRAVERSFQLMLQVSGRAGRRGIKGKVVIQTFNPQHPVFSYLLKNDYVGFYETEIQERLDFNYPPFFKLIKLTLKHEEQNEVKKAAAWLADNLRNIFGHRVIGPEAPPIARIRNKYIMDIMLKFERQNLNMAEAKTTLLKEVDIFHSQKDFKKVRLNIDVDPY